MNVPKSAASWRLISFLLCASGSCLLNGAELDARSSQFMGFRSFGSWKATPGEKPLETVLTSPELVARITWNEMVPSWNVDAPETTYIKVDARAIYLSGPTKWYNMGIWAPDRERFGRQCPLGEKDEAGEVSTDTLILARPANRLQVRVTLGRAAAEAARLKFFGVSLIDSTARLEPLAPNKAAWGTVLPVPERSQMPYPNGNVICSPTTVSMILGFWANRLDRPELDIPIPEVAKAIYDTNWKGTGNWSFNMAYAGQYKGIRAYSSRLSDLAELEDWIGTGIPVGLSLCYDLLRGRPSRKSGHLVVCVGFTESGDPVINDPGTSQNVRKVFPRANLVKAWAYSENTAYLIYPEGAEIPKDRFGHWDSWTARQRVRTAAPRFD